MEIIVHAETLTLQLEKHVLEIENVGFVLRCTNSDHD